MFSNETPEHAPLTDAELQERTASLIETAKNISLELMLQTERLATTIDKINRNLKKGDQRG